MSFLTMCKGAGAGLVAGFAGTAAISLTQAIQKTWQGRPLSDDTPATAVEHVLPVKARTRLQKQALSQAAHWAYGTAWGLAPWLIDVARIPLPVAAMIETGALQGAAMIMLPGLKVAPPITRWGAGEIASQTMHHAVYAATSTWVYRRLRPDREIRSARQRQPAPRRSRKRAGHGSPIAR